MTYFQIQNQVSRIKDGVCGRIPPSEFVHWQTMTGETITPIDYAILVDMDEVFCIAMNRELKEKREAAIEAAKTK